MSLEIDRGISKLVNETHLLMSDVVEICVVLPKNPTKNRTLQYADLQYVVGTVTLRLFLSLFRLIFPPLLKCGKAERSFQLQISLSKLTDLYEAFSFLRSSSQPASRHSSVTPSITSPKSAYCRSLPGIKVPFQVTVTILFAYLHTRCHSVLDPSQTCQQHAC